MSVFNELFKSGKKEEEQRIRQDIRRFKMEMMKHMPFYGDILMKIEIIGDSKVRTAHTNGKWIKYNPYFLKNFGAGQRNYIIMHEVMHILLLHWKRKAGRNDLIWNIACDYVVNNMLDRMKYRLQGNKIAFERPEIGCFLKEGHRNASAERLYEELLEQSKDDKDGKNGQNDMPLSQLSVMPVDLEMQDDMSEADMKHTEEQVKELIRDTIKRRGMSDSYYIPREITKLAKVKPLPWHKLLCEFLEERLDDEVSYLTPERKYIFMDLIVPGYSRADNELGEIWAFVDSSASVSGAEMNHFMGQLYSIATEFRCVINVAFWDTAVTDVYKKVKDREKLMDCKPQHSGGTDINCVYRYIREQNIRPGVLLILTDGYFGKLNEEAGKLRKKTILVVSENGYEFERKNEIGRLARL